MSKQKKNRADKPDNTVRSDYYHADWTIQSLWSKILQFIGRETEIPLEIQRRDAWTAPTKQSFLQSLFRGNQLMDFFFVDVKSAHASADLKEDKEYYEGKLINKIDWMILDAANRCRTLKAFLDDKEHFTGTIPYTDQQSGHLKYMIVEKRYWKDFPLSSQAIIRQIQVGVKVIVSASREQLHQRFQDLNRNLTLNRQELRNAIFRPASGIVRDISLTDRGMADSALNALYSDGQLKRMADDIFVAHLLTWCYHGLSGTSLDDDTVDSLYLDANRTRLDTAAIQVEVILGVLRVVFASAKESPKPSVVYSFIIAMDELNLWRNIKNVDVLAIYKDFKKKHNGFIGESHREISLAQKKGKVLDIKKTYARIEGNVKPKDGHAMVRVKWADVRKTMATQNDIPSIQAAFHNNGAALRAPA